VCLCLCVCRAYACVCDAFQYWNTYHLKIVCTCLYPLSLGIRLLSSLSCSIPRSFFLCLSVSTPSSFSRIALPTPPLTPPKMHHAFTMQSYLRTHTQYQSFKTEGPGFGEKSCEGVLFASLSLLQSTSDCLQVNSVFSLPLPLARSFCVSHCSCLSPGYF